MTKVLLTTPSRLSEIISPLPDEILKYNEPDKFSILDVLGHLIHGENDDWMPRLRLMLENDNPTFRAFDRVGHKTLISKHGPMKLLAMFSKKRRANIDFLNNLNLTADILDRKANHPELGSVDVNQLLQTWVVHDLSHINQINRILSQHFSSVGPWKEYLRIMND